MVIFFLGYMGSGKSTLGKKMAKRMNFDFIDADDFIEKKQGKSIAEIFEEEGEEYFRQLEQEFLGLSWENTIVSLGGGTPCFEDNLSKIKEKGVSVYLKLPVKALAHRLHTAKNNRPLIAPFKDDLEKLTAFIDENLSQREVYYDQADLIIDSMDMSAEKIDELATRILEFGQ